MNSLNVSSDDLATFKLSRVRRLTGNSCPDYTTLLCNGSQLAVACERPFKFEFDSVTPVTAVDKAAKTTAGNTVYCLQLHYCHQPVFDLSRPGR